jgi:uncharacterized protein YcfL
MRRLILCIIVLFILVGCGQNDLERVKGISSDAHHIGKIVEKNKESKKILVKELIANIYDEPIVVSISIFNSTSIYDTEGNEINFEDLKKGQLVEVWIDGFLSETDPVKGGAKKLILIP